MLIFELRMDGLLVPSDYYRLQQYPASPSFQELLTPSETSKAEHYNSLKHTLYTVYSLRLVICLYRNIFCHNHMSWNLPYLPLYWVTDVRDRKVPYLTKTIP